MRCSAAIPIARQQSREEVLLQVLVQCSGSEARVSAVRKHVRTLCTYAFVACDSYCFAAPLSLLRTVSTKAELWAGFKGSGSGTTLL
jgi:hypothetical protein